MTLLISEATQQWCADREHPFVTYNPWLDRSYCRCGERQEPGGQPMDWDAKRQVFHDCKPGDPCGCYATGKPVNPPEHPRSAMRTEQESLFGEPATAKAPARIRRQSRHRPIADVQLPA